MAPERIVARRTFLSHSAEATEAFAERIGAQLAPGSVVALCGELGAGKTCAVRGFARGLGVREQVHSPTFTLMHTYSGRVPVHHFDAWMQGRERAFLEGGGAEWLATGGVALVEWANRVADWLPLPRLELRLEHAAPAPGSSSATVELRRLTLSVLADDPVSEAVPNDIRSDLARLVRELPAVPGIEELADSAARPRESR
jgi:tRNA threonylcarbamoyladenosine biosynthesis protein TsaE